MQSILLYAANKIAFSAFTETEYPEVVLGRAPGMPQALCWVYRGHAFFTLYEGPAQKALDAFLSTPLRALESEVMHRLPIDTDWEIAGVALRECSASRHRVVACGAQGETSILLDTAELQQSDLENLRGAVVGKTFREVIAALEVALAPIAAKSS
ncbi:hypothetical protein PWP93_36580 [Paraburkholderia sp. A1RI-2L]|uniref:hypothetical protein n=1 Tax=Paraburkholderia sp. A1RI-2L TaxID=3028367 RepID=UPI003B7934A7